jgi:hypothetical protein
MQTASHINLKFWAISTDHNASHFSTLPTVSEWQLLGDLDKRHKTFHSESLAGGYKANDEHRNKAAV